MKTASSTLVSLLGLTVAASVLAPRAGAQDASPQEATGWMSPPADILEVLHAPQFPRAWTAPTGEYLLLADPVL